MIGRFFILLIGVFFSATSVVMTKASNLSPEFLSAGRLLLAVVFLSPLFLRDKVRYPDIKMLICLRTSFLPAVLLTLHFFTWTLGARWTTAANSTLIVNLIPIAMPFLSMIVLQESLTKHELFGTAITCCGVIILAIADYHIDASLIGGDFICILSMFLVAWYLILARKNKQIPSIWLYLVPLYAQAGILCLLTGLIRTGLPRQVPVQEWWYIFLLALLPTVFGHSLLNLAMQWFRSQFVAIVAQLQFIYAGVLGYWFFVETPHASFYLASVFMMVGVIWIVLSTSRNKASHKAHVNPA